MPAVVPLGDEGCDAAEKSSFVVARRASFGPFRRVLVQRARRCAEFLTVVRGNAVLPETLPCTTVSTYLPIYVQYNPYGFYVYRYPVPVPGTIR